MSVYEPEVDRLTIFGEISGKGGLLRGRISLSEVVDRQVQRG